MIAFFRHRFTVYSLSSLLFLGFFLKANSFIGCKWSNLVCELGEKHSLEEDQSAEDDKSGRLKKNTWDISSFHIHQIYPKYPTVSESHNRVYLMAIISAPLIAILSEPPELV